MKGAEFARYFTDGRCEYVGNLQILAGHHARGRTLTISVRVQTEHGWDEFVPVYGIVSGQPGWTEEYGWLHHGPWVEDFEREVQRRIDAEKAKEEAKEREEQESKQRAADRVAFLLSRYKSA